MHKIIAIIVLMVPVVLSGNVGCNQCDPRCPVGQCTCSGVCLPPSQPQYVQPPPQPQSSSPEPTTPSSSALPQFLPSLASILITFAFVFAWKM